MPSHGFSTLRERELPMLGVVARLLRHDATGAELLHLANDEPNRSFAVGFATLPSDDTGVAHILEHMVLAGSERYPLKDPFFEMVKGSVAGFINAMTWPDRTAYPFATDHPQDFSNLLHVYLDAVFRPRLTRETFDQEAWHLEPGAAEGTLRWRGVVFSEMKGATAHPDRVLDRVETTALLGDTPYRHDAGGDPAAIPDLTYEQLRAFHRDHYHPSRARFVLHGGVELEPTLAVIDAYLGGAAPVDPLPLPALPRRFDAPRVARGVYAADAHGKAIATVAWALPEPHDPADTLLWRLLERVLIGTPASPLRRALLDAGLGEAFVGGFSSSRRSPEFHVGLRGVPTGRAPEVHALVLATLRQVVDDGLDADDAAAARNRLEFATRELDGYGGQRGLVLALEVLGGWFHGRDPLAQLDLDRAFRDVDARLADDAGRELTAWLRLGLLEEAHRVAVTIEGDPELSRRRQEAEEARLAGISANRDADGFDRIAAAAAALEAHQRRPDDDATKATLPRLGRADLAAARPSLPPAVERRDDAEVLWIDRPTQGLLYLDLTFDLGALPEPWLPHVAMLGRALLETGTTRSPLADLTRRIDRDTGGLSHAIEAEPGLDGAPDVTRFVLRGKAVAARAAELGGLMLEVLTEARLDDRDALRRLAQEDLARRRNALEPSGHQFALRRLAAHGGHAGRVGDLLGGLASLDLLATFVRRLDDDWEALSGELRALRGALLVRQRLVAGVTADAASAAVARPVLARLIEALPAASGPLPPPAGLAAPARFEGWALPGEVHYGGVRWSLRGGARLPGSWLAAARYLSADVWTPKVRFEGGAYGAGAMLDPLHGSMRGFAYRDPNLTETLAVFRSAPADLRRAAAELTERDLDTLIVGAVGKVDPYVPPAADGYRALLRHLRGSWGEVERLRGDLLGTTRQDFSDLADALEAAGDPAVVVLGPRASLEAAGGVAGWVVRAPG